MNRDMTSKFNQISHLLNQWNKDDVFSYNITEVIENYPCTNNEFIFFKDLIEKHIKKYKNLIGFRKVLFRSIIENRNKHKIFGDEFFFPPCEFIEVIITEKKLRSILRNTKRQFFIRKNRRHNIISIDKEDEFIDRLFYLHSKNYQNNDVLLSNVSTTIYFRCAEKEEILKPYKMSAKELISLGLQPSTNYLLLSIDLPELSKTVNRHQFKKAKWVDYMTWILESNPYSEFIFNQNDKGFWGVTKGHIIRKAIIETLSRRLYT